MTHSTMGIQLLRSLATSGFRIFTVEQAKKTAVQLNMNPNYVPEALHYLVGDGWLIRLKKGVYGISQTCGLGSPLHEFEIAMALVNPSTISHWTAMHYHHLTQQTPNKIFAITPSSSSIPKSCLGGMYHFTKIKQEYYFGMNEEWIGEAKVWITDPERTLLDGLVLPQHCGDFREVLHAFRMRGDQLDLKRVIGYALRLDHAVIKRLGWVLERMSVRESALKELLRVPIKGYRKLDSTGELRGPYSRKWMIQENI